MTNPIATNTEKTDQRKATEGQSPPGPSSNPLDKPEEKSLGTAPGTIKLTVTVEDDDTPESPTEDEKPSDDQPAHNDKTAKGGLPGQTNEAGETSDWRKPDDVAPPAEDLRPKQPLDALYIEIEKGIKREAELTAQIEQLQAALDEALDMASSLHRNPLMETVTPLEHRLLPNVSDDDLNDYVVNGWQVVNVQWVVLQSMTEKTPVLCPCAHLTRSIAKSKPTEETSTNNVVVIGSCAPEPVVEDPLSAIPSEYVALGTVGLHTPGSVNPPAVSLPPEVSKTRAV